MRQDEAVASQMVTQIGHEEATDASPVPDDRLELGFVTPPNFSDDEMENKGSRESV